MESCQVSLKQGGAEHSGDCTQRSYPPVLEPESDQLCAPAFQIHLVKFSGNGIRLSQEPARRLCISFIFLCTVFAIRCLSNFQTWASDLSMRRSMSFRDFSPTLHFLIRISTLLHSRQVKCYCCFSTGTLRSRIRNDKFWQVCDVCVCVCHTSCRNCLKLRQL